MDYVPFKDYLSLSNVAWNSNAAWNGDLLSHLENIAGQKDGHQADIPLLYFDKLDNISIDPLDDQRRNATEEFRRNGVESALDEIDMYQHQIREVRASTDAETNPAMACYLDRSKTNNKRKTKKFCVFCKNNGELPSLYQNHVLKDADGRVTCPVLRKYTCPHCGENGDKAHTVRYCPKNNSGASAGLLLFLNSTRDSSGKVRPQNKKSSFTALSFR